MTNLRAVPANFGPLRGASAHARITGPCGDTMEFWFCVDEGRLSRVTFTTDGCAHSLAAGSACAQLAESRTPEQAACIGQDEVIQAAGALPKESEHCALLAVTTLREAVAAHERSQSAADKTQGDRTAPRGRGAGGASSGSEEARVLKDRLSHIRHKILVLSGKGGVGKSTVAVNLAVSLLLAGKRVGLLDVDLHGPSIPKMLKLEGASVRVRGNTILPVLKAGLKVMSVGFLLSGPDEPVIWRGPMKMHVIEQLLRDVEWGDLDYLAIDLPPGTGDEPLSICQLVEGADGAVIVTTPQDAATANVRRSIRFCQELGLPVLGVVENMSGFACPSCGVVTPIFGIGGGERMASEMGVRFLGRVPLDAALAQAGDDGLPFWYHQSRTAAGRALGQVLATVLESDEGLLGKTEERRTQ